MSAQPAQSGTDTHALIHAQEEESSIPSVDNVSALLVTGTVLHASSAPTLKSGPPQDCHVSALKEAGMDLPASSALPIKSGSQPPCNVDAQVDKTGTASHVSLAQLGKTGTLPPDHADVQSAKTGMETPASHASEEDNGTLSQDNALVLLETGTASRAFNVPPDKPGIHPAFHAPAHQALSGMALTAELAQAQADSGIINLMIVSAEPETGTELNVSFVQPTATGMEEPASPALVEDSGTQLI